MTSEDIQLIQQSWEKVEFVKDVAADLFHERLLELAPALGPLFAPDASVRRQKFAHFVATTVRGLDHPEAMRNVARELGVRHPEFAANDEHHTHVAAALLWTLQKCLRREFTPEVRGAWINAYGNLASSMR